MYIVWNVVANPSPMICVIGMISCHITHIVPRNPFLMLPRPESMPNAFVLKTPTHMLGVVVMLACCCRRIALKNSAHTLLLGVACLMRPRHDSIHSGSEALGMRARTNSLPHSERRRIVILV